MIEDKEFTELQEYIKDLKAVRSEVLQIISEKDDKEFAKAANYYPVKVNQLLTQRNIESASGCFPFLDLAFITKRKENLELLELNTKKDDIDQLRDVIKRIDQELEELS